MAVDQMIRKIQGALNLVKLRSKLPRNLKVVNIRVEDYVDTDKEDALRVTVVIAEDVDVERIDGDDVMVMKRTIHDRIRDLGVDRWPYVFVAKQSELDEDDED